VERLTIQKARQANLADYLLSVGVPLVKNGNRYRHKDHDSLVFTDNAYYWNSRRERGNAIDYLVRHMKMCFNDAVSGLTKNTSHSMVAKETSKPFELDCSMLCDNQNKVRQYLDKIRYVGYGVIEWLIMNKLLFQEEETNNAVFAVYDENNNCVGAELQGITQKRFKGVKKGSKYGYGFNVRFSDDNTFDYALFFESAIDLISFIDLKVYHEKKSLNKCILVSMAGLKPNIIQHTLKAFKDLQVFLCVDNDKSGFAFIEEIANMKINFRTCLPDEKYKDWNEQLKDTRVGHTAIGRVLKRERDELILPLSQK